MSESPEQRKAQALQTPETAVEFWLQEAHTAAALVSQCTKDLRSAVAAVFLDPLEVMERMIAGWLQDPAGTQRTIRENPMSLGVLKALVRGRELQRFVSLVSAGSSASPALLIAHQVAYAEATLALARLKTEHPDAYRAAHAKAAAKLGDL